MPRAPGLQASEVPRLFKLDIDAAFRRLPLRPEHRELIRVIFRYKGEVTAHAHCACPFGAGASSALGTRRVALFSRAVASVHNWERVGALICAILRRVLHAAILRYVDDMFGAERQADARIEPPAGAPVAAGWPSRGRSNIC